MGRLDGGATITTMSRIPEKSRTIVATRDMGRCVRCNSGASHEYHHRRGRSVPGAHQHCPGNGITLCRTCHAWVHAHPIESRAMGWIVSRHAEPDETLLYTAQFGWVQYHHEGSYTYAPEPEENL